MEAASLLPTKTQKLQHCSKFSWKLFTVKAETAAAAKVPGEVGDEEEGVAHDRPPDPDPHEVPDEEVPVAEAGRPPDPPGSGIGEVPLHDDDDDEKEIESKAKVHQQRRQRLVP